MEIKLKELKLNNFESHQDLTVNFGEVTKITGDNAEGKSTIPRAITWSLYGIDTFGSKLDPTPTTYDADETLVSLLLDVDGIETELGRQLKKGKTKYLINEVPSKASEFNEYLDGLFTKELFLSLFNPLYFFTMHWEKQRAMLLNYVTAPSNKEVFKELPEAQAAKLGALVKKHSLVDLNKIHRDNKNKLDKQYIAAQSRTKTLKEQLDEFQTLVPLPSLRTELKIFSKERDEIQEVIDLAGSNNSKINKLQSQIQRLQDDRDFLRTNFERIKEEQIQDHCQTCKQPLQGDALKAVEEDKQQRQDSVAKDFKSAVAERKKLEEELAQLEYIDVSEQLQKANELQAKIAPIEQEMQKHERFEMVKEAVTDAEQQEKETLEQLNESIFILDSIKDFYGKEAELQAKKVQDLFDRLSVKLFEQQKNGEIKTTFVIQMDGKDYLQLSLSEKIKAGLELREVLSGQSDIVAPAVVDNSESITKFKQPSGQLLMLKVVEGKELEVSVNE
ncbi:AAA family ATPase [Oceanobacillus sp. J11TS1]|uniref:AAA family ATPase n=1 Tax=Oceanobacillus sp. J11TS1 TaxID=2807191 RepID=UPI001B28E920|nr:AAA family ATPase [Oceanobacillus sp. J11TS1]GIO22459.1 hypothetical protein J11TS1_10400 [Oceanobacillus sp. J11TS1]